MKRDRVFISSDGVEWCVAIDDELPAGYDGFVEDLSVATWITFRSQRGYFCAPEWRRFGVPFDELTDDQLEDLLDEAEPVRVIDLSKLADDFAEQEPWKSDAERLAELIAEFPDPLQDFRLRVAGSTDDIQCIEFRTVATGERTLGWDGRVYLVQITPELCEEIEAIRTEAQIPALTSSENILLLEHVAGLLERCTERIAGDPLEKGSNPFMRGSAQRLAYAFAVVHAIAHRK